MNNCRSMKVDDCDFFAVIIGEEPIQYFIE